jgi:hypothetical protein
LKPKPTQRYALEALFVALLVRFGVNDEEKLALIKDKGLRHLARRGIAGLTTCPLHVRASVSAASRLLPRTRKDALPILETLALQLREEAEPITEEGS